jgi:DNA-binding NarL/FixJ family response regulator
MKKTPDDLFPFEPEIWEQTLARLQLSPQHARVAECLFHGMGDKQIAREMKLSIPTVRTYLDRISRQLRVQGRTEIMLRVVAIAQQVQRGQS